MSSRLKWLSDRLYYLQLNGPGWNAEMNRTDPCTKERGLPFSGEDGHVNEEAKNGGGKGLSTQKSHSGNGRHSYNHPIAHVPTRRQHG